MDEDDESKEEEEEMRTRRTLRQASKRAFEGMYQRW